jgi:hypothetical protein
MWRVAGAAIVLGLAAGSAHAAGDPTDAAALAAAAFAAPPPMHADNVVGALAQTTSLADGTPVEWRTGEVRLSPPTSATIDSLRITLAEPDTHNRLLRLPGAPDAEPAYEVSLVRHWPSAMSFETRTFGLDFTPHAGVGMSNSGGVAEAGATVRLSQKLDKAALERLEAMGISDGTALGGQGRWYVFAAISGRAVGLNMLRSDGGWNRGGWTTDPSSKLIGDGQLGVGWRKGWMESSVGFVHRTVKGQHMIFGQGSKPDSLVAFSFAIRPH